jgi:TOMM system kinase/cyclase fusion protein
VSASDSRGAEAEVRAIWERLQPAIADRYDFVGWLGAGAFGDVFEARQRATGQAVAIKVLRVGEQTVPGHRFHREMRACALLNHPNIVRVIDAGGEATRAVPLFTVFEFVPGQTLSRSLAAEGMLRVDEAVTLMIQVLDALDTAHAAGIVHRDLKPANVMITETARGLQAKVLDFGVAAFVDGALAAGVELTQTGERVGTPAYCAPEQLRGEPATTRVDHYAWGLVLLECLTGSSVFVRGTLHQLLQRQLSKEPIALPPPLAGHPLGEVLRWALEKDPSRRAADARALIARLRRVDLSDVVDRHGFLKAVDLPQPGPEAGFPTEVGTSPRLRGERWPVTALCCRIAPARGVKEGEEEALDEWLEDLRNTVAEIALKHGATESGAAGSEVLFYFGVHPGEEAGVRRAARAAIEIQEHCARSSGVMRARSGWQVEVRAGIHPGRITMQNEAERLRTGFSLASATASSLCLRCASGEIAVSESAALHLRDHVPVERVGEEGADAWHRLAPRSPENAVEETEPARESATATFGRDAEIERLRDAWQERGEQAPRFVVLAGPPGIGKTHLARAFRSRVTTEGVRVLEGTCLRETQATALYPVLSLLRRQLRITDEAPDRAIETLKAYVAEQGLDPASAMPLLCAWQGLPSDAWPELPISPMKRRGLFLELMDRLIRGLTTGPAILFLDDLQWADQTTLEWLSRVLRTDASRPFQVLCTMRRPETSAAPSTPQEQMLAAIVADPRTRVIDVPPLDDDASIALLSRAWAAPGNTEGLASLAKRGAGVPLFLLELARARAGTGDFVPASIAELLRTRIEQLGEAKETAQLAAVLHPDLDPAVIGALSQRREALLGDLNQLVTARMLETASDGSYRFAHALIRDSAYQSLPRKSRQIVHASVAAWFEEHRPDLRALRPWLFALHHRHAIHPREALGYGEAAAMGALMRFDNFEALACVGELKGAGYEGAGGWLQDIEDPGQRTALELRLLGIETTALMMTRGWADLELNKACARASALFAYAPVESTLPLRYALAQFYFNRGFVIDPQTGQDRSRPYIEALIESARRANAPAFVRLGQMILGAWWLFRGGVAEGMATLRQIEPGTRDDAWKYGFDAHTVGRAIEGLGRWFQGDPEVLAFSEETASRAVALQHPATLAISMLYRASLLQLTGDRDATRRLTLELMALCDRHGLQGYPGYAVILLGWANSDPSIALQAREALTAAGQRTAEAYYSALIAEAELESGQSKAAWDHLNALEALAESTGERYFLPEILRLQARCAADVGVDDAQAAALVARALRIATDQGAPGMCAAVVRRVVDDVLRAPSAQRRPRTEALVEALSGADVERWAEPVRALL